MFELIGTMIFLVCGVDVLRKWLFADNAKDWNKYLFHLFLLVIVFFVWSYGFGSLDREYEREREREQREGWQELCRNQQARGYDIDC